MTTALVFAGTAANAEELSPEQELAKQVMSEDPGAHTPPTAGTEEAPEPIDPAEAPDTETTGENTEDAMPAETDTEAATPTEAPTSETPTPETLTPAELEAMTAAAPTFQAGSYRVAGHDRFETAAKTSKFTYPGTVNTVVIANGMNYPDALSGAPLAAKLRAPLLMTQPKSIPATTVTELKRLKPKNIIVLGGTGAVSSSVAKQLGNYAGKVRRIGGSDRFDTSRRIVEYGWGAGSTTQAMIVTGMNYPDALSAAPAAAKVGAPVLLVPISVNASVTRAATTLSKIGVKTIHIAGGTAVVSSSVQQALAGKTRTVKRYAGHDRYETSAKFVNAFFGSGTPAFFWANGMNYPDALAGAAAAGAAGSALALSPQNCAAPSVAAEFSRIGAATTVGLGGTAVLSNSTMQGLRCFTVAPKPSISGKTASGSTLTAKVGTWSPAPSSSSLQWLRNGSVIRGATASTYKLTSADVGKRITVKQTVKRAGYVTSTRTSSSTATVYDSAALSNPNSTMVVVNKKRPLNPKSFVPQDLRQPNVPNTNGHPLRKVAATAIERMFAGARNAGHSLYMWSGYRSYDYQRVLYNGYVRDYGQAWADSQSARPGYSEHQTGLTADIYAYGACDAECFGGTAAGKWLRSNAHKYGFILRYDSGQTATTGYAYEPWHFRYVGVEIASDMHAKKVKTLEGYFGLPKAPNY